MVVYAYSRNDYLHTHHIKLLGYTLFLNYFTKNELLLKKIINKRMQNTYQQLSSIKHSVETCGVANTFALRPWNYDTGNRVID
jgi:hypothetical protein